MTENGMNLNEESIRHVEAAAATHRAVVELAESRQKQITTLERELNMAHMEIDRLRLDVQDMRENLTKAKEERTEAVAQRVAYETFVALLARQLVEFTPPSPPLHVHRPKEPLPSPSRIREILNEPARAPLEASREEPARPGGGDFAPRQWPSSLKAQFSTEGKGAGQDKGWEGA